MIKRIIEISRGRTRLSVKNGQLLIESKEEKGAGASHSDWQARRMRCERLTRVPCEDVGILLVDHAGTVYTHSVFTELLKYGAAVVLCGRDHHPTGMFLPVEGNSLQTERMRQQVEAKEPLKKQNEYV